MQAAAPPRLEPVEADGRPTTGSFAYGVSEQGRARRLALDGGQLARGTAYFIWAHVDGHDPECARWLRDSSGVDEAAVDALIARDTRPRAVPLGEGAIINLRGPGTCERPDSDTDLVSIRLWAERGRVITVGYYPLAALPDVRAAAEAGRLVDPGDFIAALVMRITDRLAPGIRDLSDRLDELEERVARADKTFRDDLAALRTEAIEYRRFLWPQREAIHRLTGPDFAWLAEEDRASLREAYDGQARMFEELESVRERAALLADQLWDLRAEENNQRTLVLSIVAAVFLPLGYVAGLFGMNVGGVPFAENPHGFWWMTGITGVIGLALVGYFRWRRWL